MAKESKAQKLGEGGSHNASSKKIENPYFRKKLKRKSTDNKIKFQKDKKGWKVI